MTKKLYLPLLMAIVVALFSSCKKMGPLSADYFTVTPQVLEAVQEKSCSRSYSGFEMEWR